MFEKQMRKMKMWEWALAKLGVAAFVLFVIAIWPAALNWVLSINAWYFLAVAIIAAAIVQYNVWK